VATNPHARVRFGALKPADVRRSLRSERESYLTPPGGVCALTIWAGMERFRSSLRESIFIFLSWIRLTLHAQLAIFFLYLGLRIFALATDSPATSDLAFDILACGACIMFPRLVFFAIKDNLVILAVSALRHSWRAKGCDPATVSC
jgi:hypothetical protein